MHIVPSSNKPMVCQGVTVISSDNNVVMYSDINGGTGLFDFAGYIKVILAGVGVSARMIVAEQDGSGLIFEDPTYDFTRVNCCGGERSLE